MNLSQPAAYSLKYSGSWSHSSRISLNFCCHESISLNGVTLGEFNGSPNPLILHPPGKEISELKFCGDKLRFGHPIEVTFGLLHWDQLGSWR